MLKQTLSSQYLLHSPTKNLRHRPRLHYLSDLDDIIKRDVTVVFDVFRLLSVVLRLLQHLDD